MKTARQYLEMGLDRHPRSERIAEELRTLRSQVHKGTYACRPVPRGSAGSSEAMLMLALALTLTLTLMAPGPARVRFVCCTDGVIGVALLCGIAAAAILLLRLMRR